LWMYFDKYIRPNGGPEHTQDLKARSARSRCTTRLRRLFGQTPAHIDAGEVANTSFMSRVAKELEVLSFGLGFISLNSTSYRTSLAEKLQNSWSACKAPRTVLPTANSLREFLR
jgi:hypothetical protein